MPHIDSRAYGLGEHCRIDSRASHLDARFPQGPTCFIQRLSHVRVQQVTTASPLEKLLKNGLALAVEQRPSQPGSLTVLLERQESRSNSRSTHAAAPGAPAPGKARRRSLTCRRRSTGR